MHAWNVQFLKYRDRLGEPGFGILAHAFPDRGRVELMLAPLIAKTRNPQRRHEDHIAGLQIPF